MTAWLTVSVNSFINDLNDLAHYSYAIATKVSENVEYTSVKVNDEGEVVESYSTSKGEQQPFTDPGMLADLNAIQTGEADPVLSCRKNAHIAQVDHFLLYESLLEDPELDQPRRYRNALTDLNLDRTPVRIKMRTKIDCSDGSIIELAVTKTGYIAENIPPGEFRIRAGHWQIIDDPEKRRQEEARLKARVETLIDELEKTLLAEEQQLKKQYETMNALLAEEGKFTQVLIISGAFVAGVLQRAEDTYEAVTDFADITREDRVFPESSG